MVPMALTVKTWLEPTAITPPAGEMLMGGCVGVGVGLAAGVGAALAAGVGVWEGSADGCGFGSGDGEGVCAPAQANAANAIVRAMGAHARNGFKPI
jgi:TctA family transporter